MNESPALSEFENLSQKVVETFLQSVVIFDDLASLESQPAEAPPNVTTPSGYGQSPLSSSDNSSATDSPAERPAVGRVPLNAKPVVDRFAELGTVCAVLKPYSSSDDQSSILNAASRSDIVVLDWVIGDAEEGEVTLEVMRKILTCDEQSERLRLFAIYTGEPGLNTVSDSVKSILGSFYDGRQMDATDAFRIRKGPVTIVILAKAETLGSHGTPELLRQEVPESELADRLTCEFARMTQGLLSNVALAGIASLRSQVHRILSKFSFDVDPAYLGHRLVLPNPPDAQDHLVEALGAELLAVLEDARPGEKASISAICDWLSFQSERGLNVSEPLGSFWGDDDNLRKLVDLLDRGRDGVEACHRPSNSKWGVVVERATEVFSKSCADIRESDQQFAALLVQKTRYDDSEPILTLGTIIRRCSESGGNLGYFLCLQPKCDSVRLKSDTAFPLLPLESRGAEKFRLIVKEAETGNWIRLDYDSKPRNLMMILFKPGDYPPGEVRASTRSDGKYFRDTSDHEYRWVADIKDEHASAVAANVSNSLSRPGPNYAEWHRRAMPRSSY